MPDTFTMLSGALLLLIGIAIGRAVEFGAEQSRRADKLAERRKPKKMQPWSNQ